MSSRSVRMLEMAKAKCGAAYPTANEVPTLKIKPTQTPTFCDGKFNQSEMETQSHVEPVSEPGTSGLVKCNFKNGVICNMDASSSEIDPFENLSDSDKDPDFVPFDNEYEDMESNTDVEEMAAEIERNLLEENNLNLHSTTLPRKMGDRKDRQLKRNFGKKYITAKGNVRPDRICVALRNCRKKCSQRITFEAQKIIFDQYWALGSFNLRLAYVAGLIELKPKKMQTLVLGNPTLKNRRFSCSYSVNICGEKIVVCKICIKSILGETDRFINTVIDKKFCSPGAVTSLDLRGKKTPPNKLPEDKINEVRAHINAFPAYESHYTRRDTSRKYLHGDLTISKMHKLYSEAHDNPVSLTKYNELFSESNLTFKKPKTDTCNTCETIKLKIEIAQNDAEKQILLKEQQNHHADADNAYKAKEFDKNYCKNIDSARIYTFDLQQCLPTPFLQTSVSFYKRSLWTYNLTVHDCISNEPFCYMWHEGTAKRGGNEIASCLFRHLKSLPSCVKKVIYYSDSCPGQNKNSFLGTMFLCFLQWQEDVDVIDHTFLTVGHTHMECDTDHATIEKQKKNRH